MNISYRVITACYSGMITRNFNLNLLSFISNMSLPITTIQQSVLEHWRNGGVIVSAPPGSGKTTQLPLWFLSENEHLVYLLIPKRIAVKLAAQQLSRNLGESVGQQVGYVLRNDRKTSSQTKIIATTYGTFLQMLLNDPDQFASSTIIFDEFHERALDQDVSYALVNHLVEYLDDSVKRVFMSATMNSEAMAEQTGLPHLESEGRSYPIDIRYRKTDLKNRRELAQFIEGIWRETDDHLLVFCAGIADMRRIEQHLPANTPTLILHSQLDNAPDLNALETAPSTIILATNIAESSVTLARVHTVIDLGTERFAAVHSVTGLSELKTRKISRASATQRAGRAGRLQPGLAWRCWSEDEHQTLTPYQSPEIQQTELTQAVLQCLSWGAQRQELQWLNPPSSARWQLGLDKLYGWQAIGDDTTLTKHGIAMLKMGVEPWLAHLLSLAQQENCLSSAAIFAAHFSLNRDIQYDPFSDNNRAVFAKDIQYEAQTLCQRLNTRLTDNIPALSETFLIQAIPERLIYWQSSVSGRYFSGTETRSRHESNKTGWALLLEGQKRDNHILVHKNLPVSEKQVFEALKPVELINFQPGQRHEFVQETRIGQILIKSQPLTPDIQQREAAWLHYLNEKGEAALSLSAETIELKSRWRFANRLTNELPAWPDAKEWATITAPFLAGLKRLKDLDTENVLINHLGYKWQQWLNKQVPKTWIAPSGRAVTIDYDTANKKAAVGIKLQEAFGLNEQPEIAGKLPLTLNLQAPNGRPVASVTDIKYFWADVYPEVRKELRGRYAKHPWPEDPLTSQATMKTNRQLRS